MSLSRANIVPYLGTIARTIQLYLDFQNILHQSLIFLADLWFAFFMDASPNRESISHALKYCLKSFFVICDPTFGQVRNS